MTKLEQEVPFLELTRTLDLMSRYGPHKVRGGPFVKYNHSAEDLSMIKILLDSESFARKSDSSSETSIEKRKREEELHVSHPEALSEKKPSETRVYEDAKSSDTLSISDEVQTFSRAGKPWTPEEHTAFRNLILDGCSRHVAEMRMQRKSTALDAMARKLITLRLGSGHSMEQVAEFLKKTPDQIQGILSGNSVFE